MTDRPRALVIVNASGSQPRRLGDWLAEDGIEPVVVAGEDGLPESLDGFAALVMLGGGFMPDDFDRAPWLHTERSLAAEAIERDVPTLGICLGGQLLADVAGGEVRESYGPAERGSVKITPTAAGADDPLLGHLGEAAPMIQNHSDMITQLPEDAVLLASSDLVENQAFRIGSHVRGLQFHPEASAAGLRNWNYGELAAEDIDLDALIEQADADDAANTTASRAIAAAFAAEIRASAARG